MNFNNILGQKHIIESLISANKSNKVLHSYIFEGPKGIGKRTIARTFANFLLCEDELNDVCEKCASCKLFEANNHPDLKILSSDKSIGVDEIRKIVKDISIKPYYNGKKIYIIENAENMTTGAQNALLKTLEEPPEYVIIILTAQNSNLFLPTIISRCIIKKFVRNTKEDIEKYISLKYPEKIDKSKLAVSLADGIIGNVEMILNDNNFIEFREESFKILKKILYGTKLESFETSDYFIKQKDNIDLILSFMLLWLRDLLIYKQIRNKELLVNLDYFNEIQTLSNYTDINTINSGIISVIEAKKSLQNNSNYSVTIEVMLLKIKNHQGAKL